MYSVCYFVDFKENRTESTSKNPEYWSSEKKNFPIGVARSRANRRDWHTDSPDEAYSGFSLLFGEVIYKVHSYVAPRPNLVLRCSGSDGKNVY